MSSKVVPFLLIFVILICFVLSSQSGFTKSSQNETFPNYLKYYDDFLVGQFPKHFRWGASTSSYQIEGGWNEDGKGESIWDRFVRKVPSPIADGSNGDVACDSYHKFSEDVQLLKKMKEALELKGGWLNEDLIQHFSNFAYFAFETFGDRVKTWITFNAAYSICQYGYGFGSLAPGIVDPAEKPYVCGHTVLKSHALAYRLYESVFKPIQNGRCGMTMFTTWYEPGSDLSEDIAAAERAMNFELGWFTNPIISGNYPDVMLEYVGRKSNQEGLTKSRLPIFEVKWQIALKGSWDFLGINHYTTNLVQASCDGAPGWIGDQDTKAYQDPNWEPTATALFKVVPWGFRKILNWIKNKYGNPLVLVTENGYSENGEGGLHDVRRVKYHREYINQMLKAILLDKCNVEGYAVWSLLDNFEWISGYSEKFGLHRVNFSDPARNRTPKSSAHFLAKLYENNGFANDLDSFCEECLN